MRTITAKVAIGLIIKAMREHRKMSQRHVRQETEIDLLVHEVISKNELPSYLDRSLIA